MSSWDAPTGNWESLPEPDEDHGSGEQGYQAGKAEASRDQQQAFNQGYQARGLQDHRVADQAFDNGYDAGASDQARGDRDYP